MDIIELLKVVVLGIVEGFTEWLPISSTGHLILVNKIIQLEVSKEFKDVFEVLIQLGAILAVVLLYFRKLNPFTFVKNVGKKQSAHYIRVGAVAIRIGTIVLWLKVLVACIPAGVVGLLVNDWIEEHLMDNAIIVSAALIIYGVLFIFLENRNRYKEFTIHKTSQISYQTALYIGMIQLLALIPGTSRSGSTILGAMILGCSRSASAEFSFFLGIPVMMGASLLKLLKFDAVFTNTEIAYLVLGMAIAFVVSVYSIKFLMGYIRKNDFKFFGYYRIVLGIMVLAYFGVTALMSARAGAGV